MIRGVVNARHEAVLRLRVRGPGESELDVDTVIDSGFTASRLLAGHELRIAVVPGGVVEITPLP
jgi:hypothetical protein